MERKEGLLEEGREEGRKNSEKKGHETSIQFLTFQARWLLGKFVAFSPKGRVFESRSGRHVRTLGKSFTRSCLWRVGVKLRHGIRAVSGAPLSSSGL